MSLHRAQRSALRVHSIEEHYDFLAHYGQLSARARIRDTIHAIRARYAFPGGHHLPGGHLIYSDGVVGV